MSDINNKENKETSIKNRDSIFIYSFICGVFAFIIFVLFLLFSNESKIFDISISGNRYFEDDDIEKLANVSENYFLNVPFLVESRLKKHPLINDAKVSFLDGKIISIEVEEKKIIGYSLNDEGNFEVLTADNMTYVLKENELYLISYAPLVDINNDEKKEKFCKNMNDLEPEIINEISEVSSYPFSYDPDMFEFVMADGNYCFVSLNDINKIVDYYSVSFNIDQNAGHTCIYIGDFTISAYASTCPWQE